MNRTIKTIIALSLVLTPALQLNAGSGKSAAIGIGSGMLGFALGSATANKSSNYDYDYYEAPRYVERETVYVPQPARTVTVQCPYLQRDLRNAQAQLAQERSRRQSAESRTSQLETRAAQLEAKLARSERTNDYLVSQNAKLEAQLEAFLNPQVTGLKIGQCNSGTCSIKTGTPGINRIVEVETKEQY